MRLPVIGMTGQVERARYRTWDAPCDLLPRSYSDAVRRAGATPLVIPPHQQLVDSPGDVLRLLDGLLLTGGADVDPASYAAEPHPETGAGLRLRDEVEASLARAALDLDAPVLGVCRGMQLLNVALGGTLEQHLPARLGHGRHSERPGLFGDHEVTLAPGSLAAAAVGHPRAERHAVKSFHHQGIDRLGRGLVVTGWAADEDLVEAIEAPGRRFALGVLWHPEEDERSGVIEALVRACAGPDGVPARSERDGVPTRPERGEAEARGS